MCGIVGGIFDVPPGDPLLIERMCDALRHRGPDARGVWWSDNHRVALAHRRLSIVDLSASSHQPMTGREGSLSLVFNGEIYNFQDLRRELMAMGQRFRSTGDTEVLLAAYQTWGDSFLERLEGMFALAIWDQQRNHLLIARDRVGEKPLFYWKQGREFRFASELKALFLDPRTPRTVDMDSLNTYLAFGYVPAPKCLVHGIDKLPPGHALTVAMDTGSVREWSYWTLPERQIPSTSQPDELCGELHRLLRESVRRRLIADVPVGILLSGGIDSSLVASVAASLSSHPIRTFTISFPGHGRFDEGPHARRVAEHLGADHHELPAEPASVEILGELARQFDEPIADSSMVPTYIVCKLIREHAKVALGGDGGDELFGGYFGHSWVQQMSAWRRWIPHCVREPARCVASQLYRPGLPGRNYLLGLLGDGPRSIVQVNMYFDAATRQGLLSTASGRCLSSGWSYPEQWKQQQFRHGDSLLRNITRLDFMSYLPEQILVKVDRSSMLASLEVRAPFLDRDLIEFAFGRLPDDLRATSKARKILPRSLAERLLPPGLDLTRKQGFSMPLQSWFRGSWGNRIASILREADPGLFRRNVVQGLLAQQAHGYAHTQRLFSLAMFELWRREYNIGCNV